MTGPKNEIKECVNAYVAAIGSDVALAASYYDEPAFFVGPEDFRLMQTKAEVISFLDSYWSQSDRLVMQNQPVII